MHSGTAALVDEQLEQRRLLNVRSGIVHPINTWGEGFDRDLVNIKSTSL